MLMLHDVKYLLHEIKFYIDMGFLSKVLDVVGGFSPLIGTAVNGVTSLIGSNKVADAQEKANQQNYQMFQEQLNFNREMFDKTNEYNTPVNQRKRYEDAGLNPYVMMGSDAGTATMQTAPSGNPLQPVDAYGRGLQQVGAYAAQALTNLPLHMQQVVSLREANKAAIIENAYRGSNLQADLTNKLVDIQQKLANKNLTEEQQKLLRLQQDEINEQLVRLREYNKYVGRMAQADTEKAENEAAKALEEANYQRELVRYQKTLADYLPQVEQSRINAFGAQAASAIANANWFDAQRKTEDMCRDEKYYNLYQDYINKVCQNIGIQLDNKQKRDIMPYILKQAKNEASKFKAMGLEFSGDWKPSLGTSRW